MANKTVYPYGTGGTLPSSIGIINDLRTGGVDKALAAEQGKVIGEYLGDDIDESEYVPITLGSQRNYSMGNASTTTKRWLESGKHITINVQPGEVYRLAVTSNEAEGGWYGFFTDAFVEPSANNSAIPYVSGTTRVWLSNGTRDVTVPDTAAYLLICPRDGDSHNSTWTVQIEKKRNIRDDFLPKDALDEMMEYALNLDAYTPEWAFPAATNKWVSGNSNYPYYGIFIPCSPNQVFTLVPKDDNVVRYTFLQNDSHINGASVAYASGYSGNPVSTPEEGATVTAPSNAYYLYIYVSNDGLVTNFGPASIRTSAGTVEEIVAAMTQNDGSSESEGIPSGLTKYPYDGKVVKMEPQHYVARQLITKITSVACQGGACYGDFLFMFTANNTTCWMYNLATKALVQTISIPSGDRGFVSTNHANTVNFGKEFYDANDPFPLIYVSTGYNDGNNSGVIVYRIVATTENDNTTYSLSLVQTLKFPGTSWTEFVVGDDDNCFICYTASRVIYRMKMPTLADGDMTFDLEDALEVYKFTPQPSSWLGSRGQGRMYYNGKIVYVSGVPASGEKSLFIVLDLATRTRETVIDLEELGLSSEPETCIIWNGHFCVVFRSNENVYALYFE